MNSSLFENKKIKLTEFVSASQLAHLRIEYSGSKSLDEIRAAQLQSERLLCLRNAGLSNSEISLYTDYCENSPQIFLAKHKTTEQSALFENVSRIIRVIEEYSSVDTSNTALNLEDPLEQIAAIEEELFPKFVKLSEKDIQNIRTKSRKLQTQIDKLDNQLKRPHSNCSNIKPEWKVTQNETRICQKNYNCHKPTFYTIRDNEIVKLDDLKKSIQMSESQLALKDIKNLATYKNYETGLPSKTLYLQNLPKSITELQLKDVFKRHINIKHATFRLMTGRMKGRAFVKFESLDEAVCAFNLYNGRYLNDKPTVILYGSNDE